jgi:hypothetical protein
VPTARPLTRPLTRHLPFRAAALARAALLLAGAGAVLQGQTAPAASGRGAASPPAPGAPSTGAPGAGAAVAPAMRDLPLSAAQRQRFVGRYTVVEAAGQPPTPLRVWEEGAVLVAQLRTNDPTRLLYQGAGEFRPAAAPAVRIAFAVEGGRAARLAVVTPEGTMRGTRDPGPPPPDSAAAGALFDELARMDSLLFDATFVACDTTRVNALLAPDVEFYHDLTGFKRGAAVRADFARLARECPRDQGMRRALVPGTLRVYPLKDYGAVQQGIHRFVARGAVAPVVARFVHVWRRDGEGWKVGRVLSYDHRRTPDTP